MAYKCFNEYAEGVKLAELGRIVYDEVASLKVGDYSICVNKSVLEKVLNCFPVWVVEEWEVVEIFGGMFAVLPLNCKPSARKEFLKLILE